jgi:hypothetical protein
LSIDAHTSDLVEGVHRSAFRKQKEVVREQNKQLGIAPENDSDTECDDDDEQGNQLHCLFWMSPTQVTDAQRYCAIVIHDNTYKCNKFGMHLGLFTSINSHGRTTLLAQCLVSSETTPDYQWVFNEFMTAAGRAPAVVLTDRDPAVEAALAVFPSKHRWCIWHIGQSIKKNCSAALGDKLKEFMGRFYSLNKCVDEGSFRQMWDKLLVDYEGHVSKYMSERFGGDNLERWATPWQVDIFTAGTVATSRNEGINKHVKTNLNSKSSLLSVVREVNKRTAYQAVVATHEDLATQINTKEVVGSLARSFPRVYDTVKEHCSSYALSNLSLQARLGVSDYKLTARLENECPESSTAHTALWGSATWAHTDDAHNMLLNTEFTTCDLFRSRPITEFVAKYVPDGRFVCYAVEHHRAETTKVPQIVVLYNKLEASGEHNTHQFLKFFCTCGFSIR